MAHPKGHTAFIHKDPETQREFERVGKMLSKQQEAAPVQQRIEQPNDIIITSKDGSLIVNKYDLTVWNYQTKWDYYKFDIVPSEDLPSNRGTVGGWIPFKANTARIEDSQDWVTFLTAKNYEPDTSYDSLATNNLARDWFVFKPDRTGTYYIEAQVVIKLKHIRDYDYYDAIAAGALALVKVNYDELVAYTKYAPNVTRTATVNDPTVNDWVELLDSQNKINKAALMAMAVADVGSNMLPLFVKRIDLNGSSLVHIEEGECVIPWYKIDTLHIYDETGTGSWAITDLTYHSFEELYETISIHTVGLDGEKNATPNSLKILIENFNI